jgi:hypothetical protein
MLWFMRIGWAVALAVNVNLARLPRLISRQLDLLLAVLHFRDVMTWLLLARLEAHF